MSAPKKESQSSTNSAKIFVIALVVIGCLFIVSLPLALLVNSAPKWAQANNASADHLPVVVDPVPPKLQQEVEQLITLQDVAAIQELLQANPDNRALHRLIIIRGVENRAEDIVMCVAETVEFPHVRPGDIRFKEIDVTFIAEREGMGRAAAYLDKHLGFNEKKTLEELVVRTPENEEQIALLFRKYDRRGRKLDIEFWENAFRNTPNNDSCREWVRRFEKLPDAYREKLAASSLKQLERRDDLNPALWETLKTTIAKSKEISDTDYIALAKVEPVRLRTLLTDTQKQKEIRAFARELVTKGKLDDAACLLLQFKPEWNLELADQFGEKQKLTDLKWMTDFTKEAKARDAKCALTRLVVAHSQRNLQIVKEALLELPSDRISYLLIATQLWPKPIAIADIPDVQFSIATHTADVWPEATLEILETIDAIANREQGVASQKISTEASSDSSSNARPSRQLPSFQFNSARSTYTCALLKWKEGNMDEAVQLLERFAGLKRYKKVPFGRDVFALLADRKQDLVALLNSSPLARELVVDNFRSTVTECVARGEAELLDRSLEVFYDNKRDRMFSSSSTLITRELKKPDELLMLSMDHPGILERLLAEGLHADPKHLKFAVQHGEPNVLEILLRDLSVLPRINVPGQAGRFIDNRFVASLYQDAAQRNQPEIPRLLDTYGLKQYSDEKPRQWLH